MPRSLPPLLAPTSHIPLEKSEDPIRFLAAFMSAVNALRSSSVSLSPAPCALRWEMGRMKVPSSWLLGGFHELIFRGLE